jgi:hypothetical protein
MFTNKSRMLRDLIDDEKNTFRVRLMFSKQTWIMLEQTTG